MYKFKNNFYTFIINLSLIVLIILGFITSAVSLRMMSERNCFDRIAETTAQTADMFTKAMEDNRDKLVVFTEILAANSINTDELLQHYMSNFCRTQDFGSVCIHRADGTKVSYGEHPHDEAALSDFDAEVERAQTSYISDVFSSGDSSNQKLFCQSVPIIRNGKEIAVLYGYISLEILPSLVSSTAYGGRCEFYIVDGDTGDFLMYEDDLTLKNLYDDGMKDGKDHNPKGGYNLENMTEGVKRGESGYYIFTSQRTKETHYIYYMPLGINNWSLQMRIDETTAFASFNEANANITLLAVIVVPLCIVQVAILYIQNRQARRKDREIINKTTYISEIQRNLINAHNNPDFVAKALRVIAEKTNAETVMLLTFRGKTTEQVYYWPTQDKVSASFLIGRSIDEDFPIIYDLLSSGEAFIYHEGFENDKISQTALEIFRSLAVTNIMIVPIKDASGVLKGAIAVTNMEKMIKNSHIVECVSYDFLMAITSLENHNIIKNMGIMDYLTGIKNRNAYETELSSYASAEADSIWCMFVDMNGLHEMNNKNGHKAGDIMLCTIASSMKKIFGEKNVYRLGGDEFIGFMQNSKQKSFLEYKKRLIDELEKKGCHVSVGFMGEEMPENKVFDIESLVAKAEKIMYKEKREYYAKNNLSENREYLFDTEDQA